MESSNAEAATASSLANGLSSGKPDGLKTDLVAQTFGEGLPLFEQWRRENLAAGRSRWAPFVDEEEWEMAQWMVQNLGHNQIEEFLKLAKVRPFALIDAHAVC